MYNQLIDLLLTGTTDTLIMVGVSAILAFLIGLPIALILVSTADFGIYPSKKINQSLGWVINITRSVPFLILMVALIPFTPMDRRHQLRRLGCNCAVDHCCDSVLRPYCGGQST